MHSRCASVAKQMFFFRSNRISKIAFDKKKKENKTIKLIKRQDNQNREPFFFILKYKYWWKCADKPQWKSSCWETDSEQQKNNKWIYRLKNEMKPIIDSFVEHVTNFHPKIFTKKNQSDHKTTIVDYPHEFTVNSRQYTNRSMRLFIFVGLVFHFLCCCFFFRFFLSSIFVIHFSRTGISVSLLTKCKQWFISEPVQCWLKCTVFWNTFVRTSNENRTKLKCVIRINFDFVYFICFCR